MSRFTEVFYYDETSPTCLRWKIDIIFKGERLRVSAGDVAGNLCRDGQKKKCVNIRYAGKDYKAHRIIWEILKGSIPNGMVIDHLNRNPWDNSIENLSCKTRAGNARNQSKRKDNSSGFTGIRWEGIKPETTKVFGRVTFEGVEYSKCFAVKSLGLVPALAAAILWRKWKMKELSKSINGFTDNHGI